MKQTTHKVVVPHKIKPCSPQTQGYAMVHKMAVVSLETFEKIAEALRPLGAHFEAFPVRSNDYEGGKVAFAYKMTAHKFTFVVDLVPQPLTPAPEGVKLETKG